MIKPIKQRKPKPSYTHSGDFKQVLQFKITLRYTTPPVWRRIIVPDDYTFWDLHVAITDVMPWKDYHLHVFEFSRGKRDKKYQVGIPNEDRLEDEEPILEGWAVDIRPYFSLESPTAVYRYDFGDDWVHELCLEEIHPREKDVSYPRCIGGERACPPEDCGGPFGYSDLLKVISDPQHEEHEDMMEWLGGGFDPERFDAAAVQFDDPEKRWRVAFQNEEPTEDMRLG